MEFILDKELKRKETKIIKMNLLRYIKSLERRGIVSRKPHPVIPFVLAFVSLALGIIVFYIDKTNSYALFFLAGFIFIFAILHWIVVRAVNRKTIF